jgi:hypothetical protein
MTESGNTPHTVQRALDCNEILLGFIKEGNSAIYNNVEEPGRYYAE